MPLPVLHRRSSRPPGVAEQALASCAEQSGALGVELVDVAGAVEAVAERAVTQAETFAHLQGAADGTRAAAQEVVSASSIMTSGAGEALGRVGESRDQLADALERIAELTSWVAGLGEQLQQVTTTLAGVGDVAGQIDVIAQQTHILALNARIEAARSGEDGEAFGVIADSVRQLSQQTLGAAQGISDTLEALASPLQQLKAQGREAGRRAEVVRDGAAAVDGALGDVGVVLGDVRAAADGISALAVRVGEHAAETGATLRHLSGGAATTRDELGRARERVGSLLDLSETLLQTTAGAGVETLDSPFIRAVQGAAAQVERLFEAELAAGRISRADLFDEDYRPVPHSDPAQFTTRFTALTDRLLPAVQEPLLQLDERMVFAAAVDRNGYLPTHNRVFSQPQGRDPVWNAANCRNRRIFDDRAGLAASRNVEPFLLQTYRRDMGGGTYALMKYVSAPVRVGGEHWGGVRMGYRI